MNVQIDRKHYHEVLKEGLKPFAFFYGELEKSESDIPFFRIITQNFVPLFKRSHEIKPLYEKWVGEREAYKRKLFDYQTKTSLLLEKIYKSIRTKLERQNLIGNSEIATCIGYIESFLIIEKSQNNFRFYKNYANQLKKLFHFILKLGSKQNIQPFAIIEKLNEIHFAEIVIGHTR